MLFQQEALRGFSRDRRDAFFFHYDVVPGCSDDVLNLWLFMPAGDDELMGILAHLDVFGQPDLQPGQTVG
jgi:hypothetical protein